MQIPLAFTPVGPTRDTRTPVRQLRHASGAVVMVAGQAGNRAADDLPFAAISLPTAPCDDSGLAHVTEHLVLRAARRFPSDDLYAELMLAAPILDLNASTGADRTLFHLTALTPQGRDQTLAVLAEAVFAPLLNPQHFAQERAVVAHEMAGHWADFRRAGAETLRARLFVGSPYCRAFGGLPDQVARLDLAGLTAFHQRFYRLNGAVIWLSGGEADLALLDGVLSRLAAKAPPRASAPKGAPFAPLPLVMDQGLHLPVMGWRFADALQARLLHRLMRGQVHAVAPVAEKPGMDAPQPDLRLIFAPMEAANAAAFVRHRVSDLRDAIPAMADQMADVLGKLVAEMPADPPLARFHAALQGRASVGAGDHSLAALQRLAEAPQKAREYLRNALLGHGLLACDLAPVPLGAASVARPTSGGALPARRLGLAAKLPMPAPVAMEFGVADGLPMAMMAGGESAVALPLAHIAMDDLPQAAALAQRVALAIGGQALPVVGPRGAWMAITLPKGRTVFAMPAVRALPPLPMTERLPPHQQLEHQLWAASCVQGAVAAQMARPAQGDTARVWHLLCATGPDAPRHLLPLTGNSAQGVGRPAKAGLNTCGLALHLPETPELGLIGHLLEWRWLRETVRRHGGAYGVRARVGPGNTLVCLSAQDPQLDQTLAAFRASGDWLLRNLDDDLIGEARQGYLHRLARPVTGAAALAQGLAAHLAGQPPQADLAQAALTMGRNRGREIAAAMIDAMAGAQVFVLTGQQDAG